jgi:hypothetical protein
MKNLGKKIAKTVLSIMFSSIILSSGHVEPHNHTETGKTLVLKDYRKNLNKKDE